MLVTLQSADIVSLIKSLSASNLYHNNLDESEFSYPNEKQEIIAKHKRLQDHLKTYLDQSVPSCPLSPESSNHTNRRLGCTDKELMGGILIRHSLLNETVPVRSYPKSDLLRFESYPVNGCSQPLSLE